MTVLALAVCARLPAGDMCTVAGGTRPVEGVLLPWNSDDVWPYSPGVGKAPSPEMLFHAAVNHEAEGRYYQAYQSYQRILIEYSACRSEHILASAYMGMTRALMGLGLLEKATELLLAQTAKGAPLYGDDKAVQCLERLEVLLGDDKLPAVKKIRARLKGQPAKAKVKTQTPEDGEGEVTPAVVDNRDVVPPGSKTTADEMLDRVRYYVKRGEIDAAVVYVDFLKRKFPGSDCTAAAIALVGQLHERGK
ncbi:MAG: hypothetical protein JW909_02415 [Planctomycetes bacterium]|nr:hypothetical protein [Planctomycetota bacterium]